jgi:putative membrane protein
VQAAASAATVIAMAAMPLGSRGGAGRRLLSSLVVGGGCVATTASATRHWGLRRALGAAGLTAALTGAVERVGTRTGRPFGRYGYTAALRPQVIGVPVQVPLAWFAMAVPARETAHAALGRQSNGFTRIAAGAAVLTAWDLFLDPQMVAEGYWSWARRGAYRGIPVSNFGGWFVTGLGVMAVLELMLPAAEPMPDLVAEYGVVAAMETAGFASFLGDRTVAIVGGAAMLPVAALGAARLLGRRS